MKDLVDQSVIDLEIDLQDRTIKGYHIGSRKIV
jgi:hypothetical protein